MIQTLELLTMIGEILLLIVGIVFVHRMNCKNEDNRN